MSPDTALAAAITSLGVIIAAGFAWLGTRQTLRAGSDAGNVEKQDREDAGLIAEWKRLYARQETATAAAQQRADDAHDAARRADEKAQQALVDLADEKQARQLLGAKLASAFGYIRALLAVLRTHDIAAPDPPDDLDIWP